MSSKGWFNLETAAGTIPETQFFEGDSAFKVLGLTRTQRLYGFAGWYVRSFGLWFYPYRPLPLPGLRQQTQTCYRRRATLGFLSLTFDCSYVIGLVLSVLGTVMFFIGGLASFAGASSLNSCFCYRMHSILTFFLLLVLYALGTVVSLIGTGFLIGVRLFFSLARRWVLTSWKMQSKQFRKQLKLVSGGPACRTSNAHQLMLFPFPFFHPLPFRCSSPSALWRRSSSLP
jgi:hypothetical protein